MKLRIHFLTALFAAFLMACSSGPKTNFSDYVDPFIGTGGHGHTFPGATRPFALVQLSPDTGIRGWDWCSGYHASDNSIMGFSHTHLSGTGGPDLGDIMFMPTVGDVKIVAGSKENPDEGYRSRFSKAKEKASAGYYEVHLDDYGVDVALTSTRRAGYHQYSYPESAQSNIIIDLKHGVSDGPREGFIKKISDTEVVGYRRSKGWAMDHTVFFVAKFSKPFEAIEIFAEDQPVAGVTEKKSKNLKAALRFKTGAGEKITAKVGISGTSIDGARLNLDEEIGGKSFAEVCQESKDEWEVALAKIAVKSGSDKDLRTYYTALYHAMVAPYVFSDVDGKYTGMDRKIHQVKEGEEHYTLFSLWDTFRATHPLFTIIAPEKNDQFTRSLLDKYDQYGMLPIWELHGNETNCMIGYHSVPVIADAILKGQSGVDAERAYKAMKHSAMADISGLNYYKEMGFIPCDKESNSVSKSVEYAFDDWCIAQVAKKLGKTKDYEYFTTRSQSYQKYFDSQMGLFRGREINGRWNRKTNPLESSALGSGDYTEGNAWQWGFFAPHDVEGLIGLHKGDKQFTFMLDSLFEQQTEMTGHSTDVTGLIGQYAQGNEPSHHVAYLYNFAGEAWKTQARVRDIMEEMYTDQPDGLSGNEDCGQMSSWLGFSALGFYPVNPASGEYIIGSPLFDEAVVTMGSGKTFTVKAQNNSKKNVYVQSMTLNGKPYAKTFIKHSDLEAGGELVFVMGPKPNKNLGTAKADRPESKAFGNNAVAKLPAKLYMPFVNEAGRVFKSDKRVSLASTQKSVIRYTTDGTEPTAKSPVYKASLKLRKTTTLKAKAFADGFAPSPTLEEKFVKAKFNVSGKGFPKISLEKPAGKAYNPGTKTLLDGQLGTENLRDGKWSGFQGDDLVATVDLGGVKPLTAVSTRFLENTSSWLFLPTSYEVEYSKDGKNFRKAGKLTHPVPTSHPVIRIKEFSQKLPAGTSARYIKVRARNVGTLPSWHLGGGSKAWMFADEIIVE
ncbi:alpha-1 2-mannosidase (plasmid) [Fulvitalea axinellae]|uniref:Alpha-1 2-mannosidase n=1 Tax=Fulvitalea axinellae TaxID=1182444 RepID=A0AAU9DEA8_9BACT|nr:alpha-1 2-mannosidase [Fulvitalea axinellae]